MLYFFFSLLLQNHHQSQDGQKVLIQIRGITQLDFICLQSCVYGVLNVHICMHLCVHICVQQLPALCCNQILPLKATNNKCKHVTQLVCCSQKIHLNHPDSILCLGCDMAHCFLACLRKFLFQIDGKI